MLLGLWLSWTGLRHSWKEAPLWRKGGSILAFGLSTLLGTFFLYYIFYSSYQIPGITQKTEQLVEAPDLVLTNHLGEPVALTDFRGSPLVLTFYRGYW